MGRLITVVLAMVLLAANGLYTADGRGAVSKTPWTFLEYYNLGECISCSDVQGVTRVLGNSILCA